MLLVGAGDFSSDEEDTPGFLRAQVAVEAMGRMGYDALTLGRREIRLWTKGLEGEMGQAPIICTNLIYQRRGNVRLCTPVPITDLRPGTMLVERVVRDRDGHYQVQVKQYSSFLSAVRGSKEVEVVVDPEPMGLSEAEVAELQKLATTGGLDHLRVQGSFPFVSVILVGFVLTVLCRQVFVFTVIRGSTEFPTMS